jgi:hypothetical protein
MTIRILLASLCFAPLAMVDPAFGVEIDKRFQESFDAGPDTRLELWHGDGDVNVSVWDRDLVDIEVRYRAEVKKVGVGARPDFHVEFVRDGGTILVRSEEKGDSIVFGLLSFHVYEHVYEIRAPAHVELDLHGKDGNVSVAGWRGEILCDLEDGDVRLEDVDAKYTRVDLQDGNLDVLGLRGDLSIHVQDGDIALSECSVQKARIRYADGDLNLLGCGGDFEIRGEDGEVRLREHQSGPLKIESSDGDVRVELVESEEIDLDVVTRDGSVQVVLTPGISAVFDIGTRDGRVDVDVPGARFRDRSRHATFGETAGGEGKIRIRTHDGSVELFQSG